MKIQYGDIFYLGLLVLFAADNEATKTEEQCMKKIFEFFNLKLILKLNITKYFRQRVQKAF
jgi:hypothetical protein